MKTTLTLLALCLLAGCGNPYTRTEYPLIVTDIELTKSDNINREKPGKYYVGINRYIHFYTDTLYHIGDTIK